MKLRLFFALAFATSVVAPAQASNFSEEVGKLAPPAVVVASVLPALQGSQGFATAARRADGVIAAVAIASVLKNNIHEWRPDHSDRKSFPSAHAAGAFAIAGALSEEHPKQKLLYFGLASLVAWSRVEDDKHHWHDVAAGAAIGLVCGKWSVDSQDGVLIGRRFRF